MATIEVRTYDEVDPRQVRELWAHAFGNAPSSESWGVLRLIDRRIIEPLGLFAVEEGQVLGSVLLLRLELQLPQGQQTVGGISAVATMPSAARRGVASLLLEAAHGRLREVGLDLALLMTRRSWVSHGFYRKRGYHDVADLQMATRTVLAAEVENPSAAQLHQVPISAQATFYWLFRQQVDGGLGFVHRDKDHLTALERSGDLSPTELWLASDPLDGTPIGYAIARRAPYGAFVREVCALGGKLPAVLAALEVTFGGEALHIAPLCGPAVSQLRACGCSISTPSWSVLMAADLRAPTSSAAALQTKLGTNDDRFWLCGLDQF